MKESRAALQKTCLTFHITYEHVTIHVERPSIFEARCNLFEPIDPHLLLVLASNGEATRPAKATRPVTVR